MNLPDGLAKIVQDMDDAGCSQVARLLEAYDHLAEFAEHSRSCKGLSEVPRECSCGLESTQRTVSKLLERAG